MPAGLAGELRALPLARLACDKVQREKKHSSRGKFVRRQLLLEPYQLSTLPGTHLWDYTEAAGQACTLSVGTGQDASSRGGRCWPALRDMEHWAQRSRQGPHVSGTQNGAFDVRCGARSSPSSLLERNAAAQRSAKNAKKHHQRRTFPRCTLRTAWPGLLLTHGRDYSKSNSCRRRLL